MIVADLMLDLDVFQGPFDLLLALVLREEVELADVPIAEIVVAYVERAYEKGELDLESASEFLVLMAALLEIKVRLLFPGDAPVLLEVQTSDGPKTLRFGPEFKVRPDGDFFAEAKALLGDAALIA